MIQPRLLLTNSTGIMLRAFSTKSPTMGSTPQFKALQRLGENLQKLPPNFNHFDLFDSKQARHMRTITLIHAALAAECSRPDVLRHIGVPLQRAEFPVYNAVPAHYLEQQFPGRLNFFGNYRAVPYGIPATFSSTTSDSNNITIYDYMLGHMKSYFPQLNGQLAESANFGTNPHFTGSFILGYPETFAGFRRFARQKYAPSTSKPVCVVQTLGDSAFMGLSSESLHHPWKMLDRQTYPGPKDGYVLWVNLNNMSISLQIKPEDTIANFNQMWGQHFTSLGILDATKLGEVCSTLAKGVQESLNTGKPHVLFTTKQRTLGHASEEGRFRDQAPKMLAQNYIEAITNLSHKSDPTTGAQLAEELYRLSQLAYNCTRTILDPSQVNLLSATDIQRITNPAKFMQDKGRILSHSAETFLITNGSITAQDSFGEAINNLNELSNRTGKNLKIFTQEDMGTYNEFTAIRDRTIIESFVPNETTINWLAIAFRSIDPANIAIIRAPHSQFQEASSGPLNEMTCTRFYNGTGNPNNPDDCINGNTIIIEDAFSIGQPREIGDHTYRYAKVGSHHHRTHIKNKPNTVHIFPPNIAYFKAFIQSCYDLYIKKGMSIEVHLPTVSFSKKFNEEIGKTQLGINDVLHIKTKGQSQPTVSGEPQEHIFVTYGPFIYDLVKTLNGHVNADVYCFISSELPQSFIDEIQLKLNQNQNVCLHSVDPDSLGQGFLTHQLNSLFTKFDNTILQHLTIRTVYVPNGFIPVGSDPFSLNPEMIMNHLKMYGFFSSQESDKSLTHISSEGETYNVELDTNLSSTDREAILFSVEVGDMILKDQVIATIEEDKSSQDILSPVNGRVISIIRDPNQSTIAVIEKIEENSDVYQSIPTSDNNGLSEKNYPVNTTIIPVPNQHKGMLDFKQDNPSIIEEMDLRELKELSKKNSVSLSSILSFIIAHTIQDCELNYRLDDLNQVHYDEPIIGFAVNRKEGAFNKLLVVPINMNKFINPNGIDLVKLTQYITRLNDPTISLSDIDLHPHNYACVFSNAGKDTAQTVIPMNPNASMIIAPGRIENGTSNVTCKFCHATFADGQQLSTFFTKTLKSRLESPDNYLASFKKESRTPQITFRYGK